MLLSKWTLLSDLLWTKLKFLLLTFWVYCLLRPTFFDEHFLTTIHVPRYHQTFYELDLFYISKKTHECIFRTKRNFYMLEASKIIRLKAYTFFISKKISFCWHMTYIMRFWWQFFWMIKFSWIKLSLVLRQSCDKLSRELICWALISISVMDTLKEFASLE